MKERELQAKIIYGPVDSRRLGRSLGVNILPTAEKVCSFDCLYCQYGMTARQQNRRETEGLDLPSAVEVAQALSEALPNAGVIDAITLAGNGEPTLHPSFSKIAEVTARLRDRLKPGVPVCILSNSSTLGDLSVRMGLRFVDRRIMKLDSGTELTFQKINRPRPGITLKQIVEGLAALEKVEIQALFIEGSDSNSAPAEVEAWIQHLELIKPSALQIYSLDRVPAVTSVLAVSGARLEEIGQQARSRLPGTAVRVFQILN